MSNIAFHLSDDDIERIAASVVRQLREQPLPTTDDERLLSESEAAARLSIARHTLRDARLRGEIEFVKIGKQIRYSRAQLAGLSRRIEGNGTNN